MDGLAFVRSRLGPSPMPMAKLFEFELLDVEYGKVRARATPSAHHYNPLDVVHGGFASTVLDIALGLVSISVLSGDASGAVTTDLTVRYIRAIHASTGPLLINGSIIHCGRRIIVAEASLVNENSDLYACAQSTCMIVRENFAL